MIKDDIITSSYFDDEIIKSQIICNADKKDMQKIELSIELRRLRFRHEIDVMVC